MIAPKLPVLKLGAITILLSGLLGCGKVGLNVPITKIGDLQQNRTAYSTVYVKGRVENQAPFLGTGAYEVRDGTGSIWVLTTRTLPNPGDEVLLKGEVQYKSIPINGQDLGEVYIAEIELLNRTLPQ